MIKFSELKEKSKVVLDNTLDQAVGAKEGIGMILKSLSKMTLAIISIPIAAITIIAALLAVPIFLAFISAIFALPIAFIISLFCADIAFGTIYLASFIAVFVVMLLK